LNMRAPDGGTCEIVADRRKALIDQSKVAFWPIALFAAKHDSSRFRGKADVDPGRVTERDS